MTLKQTILKHLDERKDWLPAYKLQSVETSFGWIGSSGSRRCRELYEAGLIERRLNGKYVEYRHKSPKVETYRVIGNRDKQEIKLSL